MSSDEDEESSSDISRGAKAKIGGKDSLYNGAVNDKRESIGKTSAGTGASASNRSNRQTA